MCCFAFIIIVIEKYSEVIHNSNSSYRISNIVILLLYNLLANSIIIMIYIIYIIYMYMYLIDCQMDSKDNDDNYDDDVDVESNDRQANLKDIDDKGDDSY